MGCMILAAALAISGCGKSEDDSSSSLLLPSDGGVETYTATYDGNEATGGDVPVDATQYTTGMSVVVQDNTGALVRTGFTFAGWNTQADGAGITYSEGAAFVMGNSSVTLYAKWVIPGELDTSFDPGDGADNTINCIAVQSDGKILIAGEFTTYNGTPRNRIARLNADGTLDESFNPGTGANNIIYSMTVQSDGKILIGGNFTYYNDTKRIRIARLNTDGTLDTTFDPGLGANKGIYSIAVQEDGKILIGGAFECYNDPTYKPTTNHITRLNDNGTLDTTFHWNRDEANGDVYPIAVLGDGKLLIAGNFTTYGFDARNRIARLDDYGWLDTSFDPGCGADNNVRSMAVLSDGTILIAGHFTTYNGTPRNHIARLNADGTLDTTFDPGDGANAAILAMAVQSDGKILIAGFFTTYHGTPRNRIARIWN